MHKILVVILFCSLFTSCKNENTSVSPAQQSKSLLSYVNPFIGTGGHGHTYPGATMPFGMMQLSPDTRIDGWDGCSGYHYSDNYIYGFTHTHLSGTGVSDYGDVLLMPTSSVEFNNGANGQKGYGSKFSHQNELASPGYYQVHLDDTNINVELTTSKRSGMHKYSFPSADNQIVILDLVHRDQLLGASISIVNQKEITGFRHSNAWADHQKLFYNIQFSHPIKNWNKKQPFKNKAALELVNPNNEPVYVKVGISAVSEEGAKNNLKKEIGDKTFEQVKKDAEKAWEHQLEKIVLEGKNEDELTNFYTAMYHTMIAPNLYQDVDGKYRGMDLKIHQATNFEYYTVFSLWDTYRATHPLFTIIEQNRTNDFVKTFIAKYEEGGIMPIWDLSANYTGCMIGYHAVPVIADAYLKGIKEYDVDKAFQAMTHSATRNKLGLDSYKKNGFIPVENESESVSKTLEYAYDDWTIAQMAKALGKTKEYKEYTQRAQYYKNVFDPSTQFMRGRFRNTWFAPFDPYEVNFNYTEANSWQYSFYVPQDISGFINLLGGKDKLEKQLDKLFTAEDKTSGRHQVDITGLIGQYAHGNEPSHHMAYLYNFVNKPHKTQEKIRQILTELYTNTPDGISGNEDCGQMSAWYILSSLGFYPVTPASNDYIIGNPLFPKATINLENGKKFTVVAKNISQENIYIKSAKLNGGNLSKTFISHSDIVNGGTLVFEMSNTPSGWGTKDVDVPSTAIEEHLITPSPFIAKGDVAFKNSTQVTLANADTSVQIYYKLGNAEFVKYEKPFEITNNATLQTYAVKNDIKSPIISTNFSKIDPNLKLILKSKYENQYNGGGQNALIDGILGAKDFRTGTWQGYHNKDVEAIVDLGSKKDIQQIKVNFLKDQKSWIFLPTEVICEVSNDGVHFEAINNGKIKLAATEKFEGVDIAVCEFAGMPQKYRYVKIIAKELGVLPKWHLGYKHDGRSWIFVDEIQIK